ncbi:MAG: WhiB family transcriptional regulator [Pseudonocardia sp.]|nr:WhiB family transcriptional regulator [Pseudonocardia sp.]
MTAARRSTHREPVAGHVQPGDFRHRAACRSVDPEIFFPAAVEGPEYEMQVSVAKAVCAGCPVLAECLAWALGHQPDGIAGGMTEHERRQDRALRRGTGRRSPVVPQRPAGGTRREVAAAGRAAIAAGLSPQDAAGAFGVSPRTAGRWAHAVHTGTRSTSRGKDAPAATSAPFQISHTEAQAGTRAEGNRS